MEKWKEMSARHKRERLELVQSIAESNFSIKQACRYLDVEEQTLRIYAYREGIKFLKEKGYGMTAVRK